MNFFVIILLWQHILYLCTLFLVHEKQRTQIKDMLYVLPDDDKRYAIETCRSSGSVLKSDLK